MLRFAAVVGVAAAHPSWEEFKSTYGKVYNGDDAHKQAAYESNLKIIDEHNAKGDFQLGVNQFADLDIDEFSSQYFGLNAPASPHRGAAYLGPHVHDGSELPTSVDWTTQGAVTPIKDQGQCGSCWAFSTTGSMEGAYQLASGKLVSMSEQQLVDCASSYGNQGCNGGLMDDGFDYAETTAIATEASYPYKGKDGTCKSVTAAAMPKGSVTGYKDVTKGETDLMSALAVNPVSIAVEANLPAFQLYKSGIMSGLCGAMLDHGILAVGYGTLDGTDYWKVKNSWGTSWGEAGYGLLKRGKGGSGECGILKQASYPVISAAVAAPANLREMAAHVNSLSASWTAKEPTRFGGEFEDVKMFLGTIMQDEESYVDMEEYKEDDSANADIPTEFDVRTNWPACASVSGHIRDQSACGSCWAFGSTEAFNDRRCIATGDTTLLSVEDTTANCGFLKCFSMGCNGGQPGQAWSWFKNHGVVTGGDFEAIGKGDTCGPYSFQPCAHHVPATEVHPACPSKEYSTPSLNKCSESAYGTDYSSDKKKAASSYGIKGVANIQTDLMTYGTVTAAFTVYADFPTYASGVYHHVSGSQLGGHAIKILGWGVEDGQDYWTVANSWNEEWGNGGTFKIRRGSNECGIEGQISAGHVAASEVTV